MVVLFDWDDLPDIDGAMPPPQREADEPDPAFAAVAAEDPPRDPRADQRDPKPGLSRCSSDATIVSIFPGDSEYDYPTFRDAADFWARSRGAESRSRGDDAGRSSSSFQRRSSGDASGDTAPDPLISGDASGDTAPEQTRRLRDTAPLEGAPRDARERLPVDALNDRPDVGNIGWMCGNWGSRASDYDVQGNIDLQIKRGPAQILGLCECERLTQDILESAAVAADADADPQSLAARPGFEYWTVRGNEERSNLLAVRKNVGRQPELLLWDRVFEGEYKTKKGRANAYSRFLICKVNLTTNVGFFGEAMVIMVVHLHFKVAHHDKGLRKNQLAFWGKLVELIRRYDVCVVMGDLNMSLFKVVPELRSRGLQVDLAAWYPWKSTTGQCMADSCGIWLINKNAVVTLVVGLDQLHDRDESGIAFRNAAGYAVARTAGGFDVCDANAGPGQPLDVYLPKAGTPYEKLAPSLTPTFTARNPPPAVAGDVKGDGKGAGKKGAAKGRVYLIVKEKRLDRDLWRYKGDNHKGSHFPICAFTNNVGRRSNDRYVARAQIRSRGKGVEKGAK